MWVALEDVDEDNGPVMVMESGHRLAELDREEIATKLFGAPDRTPAHSDELWVTYQNRVTEIGRELGVPVKTVPVKKGSTILWHPQLPHGGAPIRDRNCVRSMPKGRSPTRRGRRSRPNPWRAERLSRFTRVAEIRRSGKGRLPSDRLPQFATLAHWRQAKSGSCWCRHR